MTSYRVCHGFRLGNEITIIESILTTFESSNVFEEPKVVPKIGSSLQPNHHYQIKLVQICEKLWRSGWRGSKIVCQAWCIKLWHNTRRWENIIIWNISLMKTPYYDILSDNFLLLSCIYYFLILYYLWLKKFL